MKEVTDVFFVIHLLNRNLGVVYFRHVSYLVVGACDLAFEPFTSNTVCSAQSGEWKREWILKTTRRKALC